MAREEIIEKLNHFLALHNPINEECEVVYLIVEIRKILDHENDHRNKGQFTLLRFYCDWTVHTKKSFITDNIKEIMGIVYEDVRNQITSPGMAQAMSPIMQFTYMDNLRKELQRFLDERNINSSIVNSGWLQFIQIFVKVLENQPIINPIAEIKLFSFLPAANGCVQGTIEFSHQINGRNSYLFGNSFV